MTPTVSVVVPSYNKSAFVGETLRSLLSQEGVHLDVIVVDDASTDGSPDVIAAAAADDPRVRYERLSVNLGGGAARNHGAAMATGQYLMFLDADDLIHPGTLLALATTLGQRTDAFGVCRWTQIEQAATGEWVPRTHRKSPTPPGGDAVRAWLTENWYYPPCAVLWPRALYDRSGGWDPGTATVDDADIMVRMLIRGAELVIAPSGGAVYRVHGTNASVSKQTSAASVRSRILFLENAAAEMERRGVADRYAPSLGRAYYQVAMQHATLYPELMFACLRRADELSGRTPLAGTPAHRFLWKVLGIERKVRLTRWLSARLPRGAGETRGAPAPPSSSDRA